MPSGRLGAVDLTANTNVKVYEAPSGKLAVLNVNLCNRTAGNATVRLAVASTDSPSGAEWIEYGAVLKPSGVLERTGIVLDAGRRIVAWSNVGSVSVVCTGYEESV